MNDLITFIRDQIQNNEMFTGLVGGSVAATLLYSLKALPAKLWGWIQWLFLRFLTIEVTVSNADFTQYSRVARWLNEVAGHKWNKFNLEFAYSTSRSFMTKDEEDEVGLGIGFGSFGFFHKGQYYRISRTKETQAQTGNSRIPETISIRVFSRSKTFLNKIVQASQESKKPSVLLPDTGYSTSWGRIDFMAPRSWDTIFIPNEQKERIIEDIDWFRSNYDIYEKAGIPCYRGYMFHGPAGTGKTSITRAMATYIGTDLYLLPLGDVTSDKHLIELVNNVEEGSVLVFEDIDVVGTTVNRQKKNDGRRNKQGGVTLGGLLQALDGVNASSRRVVVMTTNHPEKLDPALVRPGRIDLTEEIKPIDKSLAIEMANKGFGPEYVDALHGMTFPATGADIQARLLAEHKRKSKKERK